MMHFDIASLPQHTVTREDAASQHWLNGSISHFTGNEIIELGGKYGLNVLWLRCRDDRSPSQSFSGYRATPA